MIDRARFFAGYRQAFGPLRQDQVDGLNVLLGLIDDDPFPDTRWIAYLQATIKHECDDTWRPIGEHGVRAYFDKYEPGTRLGKILGNTHPGDGVLFRGRGYSQLSGRANYARLGALLGVDLIGRPALALVPVHAYRIACIGMAKGLFTGVGLGHFINAERCDYVGARRVVNGVDRAELIAGYARAFETILVAAGSSESPIPVPPSAPMLTVAQRLRALADELEGR